MPCWYYDKKELRDTPSIKDGISFETERRYRKEGARFIMGCGTQLGLGHNTLATGVVYFHRFYMQHSFKNFPRYVTACCCLFLAGKVEETPKKCRDIIKTARGLLSDNYFYSFGEDPKEEVMTLERILLQTIKFDLQVEHPYSFLLKYAKCIKGDQQKLQKMVQMAWNFVNDSLSTVVCLQWEPEIIAVALIHLASKLSKFTVIDWTGRQPGHTRWWDMFVADVTMEILEDICHQVLDLYQSNNKETTESQSPPQKPPSRSDSPTIIPANRLPITNTNNGSPTAKLKVLAPPLPVTATAAVATVPATIVTTTPNANNCMAGAIVGELSNIQAIKSLANNGASLPLIASTQADTIPPTPGISANANNYHLYHAPPAAHPLYNSVPPPGPPPPPPPPQPPIAPPFVNTWTQAYNTAPPPPMPHGGSAGYFPQPTNSYGRQSQSQQSQNPSTQAQQQQQRY